MRLLIVAQTIDSTDPVLGFFHAWVKELAPSFESVEVICLFEGEYHLPDSVQVHSLGKDTGEKSSIVYAFRFLLLAWKLRHSYDAVFVHMNQEYVLLAGALWRSLGKPVYMWRNHYAGSWLTRIAGLLCTTVFCTSQHSYTARFKNTRLMPVGVDVSRFSRHTAVERAPRTILFLARIAPSKRPELLIDALAILASRGVSYTASFYGSPLSEHVVYAESLKERVRYHGIEKRVFFHSGVPNDQAPGLYEAHEIFVNTSLSGMFDKTLFEAALAGALVVASSDDFARLVPPLLIYEEGSSESLAKTLEEVLHLSSERKEALQRELEGVAKTQSLESLVKFLTGTIQNAK